LPCGILIGTDFNGDNHHLYAIVRADCWECIYQVQNEVNGLPGQEENESGKSLKALEAEKQKIIDNCMTGKGYKKTWDYSLYYNIRKGFFDYGGRQYKIAGK
jgi:hypothetical protein